MKIDEFKLIRYKLRQVRRKARRQDSGHSIGEISREMSKQNKKGKESRRDVAVVMINICTKRSLEIKICMTHTQLTSPNLIISKDPPLKPSYSSFLSAQKHNWKHEASLSPIPRSHAFCSHTHNKHKHLSLSYLPLSSPSSIPSSHLSFSSGHPSKTESSLFSLAIASLSLSRQLRRLADVPSVELLPGAAVSSHCQSFSSLDSLDSLSLPLYAISKYMYTSLKMFSFEDGNKYWCVLAKFVRECSNVIQ